MIGLVGFGESNIGGYLIGTGTTIGGYLTGIGKIIGVYYSNGV